MANEQAIVLGLIGLGHLFLQKADFLKRGIYGTWGRFIFLNMALFVDWFLILYLQSIAATFTDAFNPLLSASLWLVFIPNMFLSGLFLIINTFDLWNRESLAWSKKVFGVD